MSDCDGVQLTDDQILGLIKTKHKWGLKDGVLIAFGIDPKTFDFEEDENGNSHPARIYNWCCKTLNGFPLDENKNAPPLPPAGEPDDTFKVLRDDLFRFLYYHWPHFVERSYQIWLAYRTERDGLKLSSNQLRSIAAYEQVVIKQFRAHEAQYRAGNKFPTQKEMTGLAAEMLDANKNTVRSHCKGIKLNTKWAIQNNHKFDNSDPPKKLGK